MISPAGRVDVGSMARAIVFIGNGAEPRRTAATEPSGEIMTRGFRFLREGTQACGPSRCLSAGARPLAVVTDLGEHPTRSRRLGHRPARSVRRGRLVQHARELAPR